MTTNEKSSPIVIKKYGSGHVRVGKLGEKENVVITEKIYAKLLRQIASIKL